MVQAARSGVQNIAEGSKASGTSKKTEMKLTNVARASLEELRLDFEDFLRQRKLRAWNREDPRRQGLVDERCKTVDHVVQWVGDVYNGKYQDELHSFYESTESTLSTKSTYSEIAANAALTLIAVACGLLDRQLKAQSDQFLQEGGFTERLYRQRKRRR